MSVPRAVGRARIVIQKTFDTSATVLRKVMVEDSSGGSTDTYPAVATYRCSLNVYPLRPVEREYANRIQGIRYWGFTFPFDADVRGTDRLKVGTRTFEVAGAGADSINIALHIVAMEIL